MPKKRLQQDEIYIDYLIAKVTGEEIKTVYEKHNCSRMAVHIIIKSMERKDADQILTLQNYLNGIKEPTKRDKQIQTALIRYMYNEGFTIEEIAKRTKKTLNNIRIVLFG